MRAKKRAARRNFNSQDKCRTQDPADQRSTVRAVAELILDGSNAELIRDPATGRLFCLDYQQDGCKVERRVEIQDQVSLAGINPSILRALTLPSRCGRLGSTAELFEATRESLTSHGIPEEAALPVTYFTFSTWFPECLPVAPCLSIMGPRPEADLLLQLLRCIVRHPLALREVTRGGFFSLPLHLPLTLLIMQEHMSRSLSALLCASNHPNANVPWKKGLLHIYCSKAVYRGCDSAEENYENSTLRINLSPSRGRLPLLNAKDMQEITEELQPRLLAYRRRNLARVRQSQFDLPEFTSGIRILARVLGASIVDAPELQAGLDPLLREYHEETRAVHWLDSRCVVIEAALYHCHDGDEKKIHVGKIASTTNAILKGRGKTAQLEDKEIGGILRALGFSPKRDKKGFAIRLDDGIRRHIHQLAARFDVAAAEEGVAMCPHCSEIVATDANENLRGAARREQ